MSVLADSHMHTKEFSPDAKDNLFDMCQTAIDRGLSHICFTEHVDYNPTDSAYGYFKRNNYLDCIERARDRFGDKINILSGIEFGELHLYKKAFEAIQKDYDVVMVGMHYIGRGGVGLHWFSGEYGHEDVLKEYSNERVFREYYEELLEAVKVGGFDVLAHFDNPKRYLKESGHEQELMSEILHELVNAGIAIEINTSPHRKGYNECSPDNEILQQYLDLGGTRVSIGSDAHCCADIARDFDYAAKLISDPRVKVGVFKERRFVTL